jgi:5-methylcytosine-specific restriction protein B
LTYSQYQNNYLGLKVRVSFGQGGLANVPWLSFLRDGQTTQKGIYPVYLFYKELDILILAYGVSETFQSDVNWKLNNAITIEKYFEKNGFGKPFRYGKSFVYKSYNAKDFFKKEIINNDLTNILNIYKSIDFNINYSHMNEVKEMIKIPFEFGKSIIDINNSGLIFNENIICRITTSLLTKPFLILTGLSGSGKTKLAQAFAMWLCGSEEQYKIVPVGADWTNREPLLGFPNALQDKAYVRPESGVLELILKADNDKSKPYFFILDEMNLSHVERYFADFLSTMESGEEILLHAGDEDWSGIPPKIRLPINLFIVGTVNIDETTYMFSPKVLDRANVIEFRVTAEEMSTYLNQSGKVDLDILKGQGASMEESFVALAQNKELNYSAQEAMNAALIGFFSQLKVAGAEFGYRTASEIRRFAAVAEAMETHWQPEEILDVVIMQKLLPKLHGSRRKLEPVLKTLITLCLSEDAKAEDYLQPKADADSSKVLYPIALEKLQRMYRGLIDNGFTSYAEA